MQFQEHLLTAREIERLSTETEAQLLRDDGTLLVKTPSADAMGRNNSPLVPNDLQELQLPPIGGPMMATAHGDEDVLAGAEIGVEAQRSEEYEGNLTSEAEGSDADNRGSEEEEEDGDVEDGVDTDMSEKKLMAFEERASAPKRVPRVNYVALIRNYNDGKSRGVMIRSDDLEPVDESIGGSVQDWLDAQPDREFGDAGFGSSSRVFVDQSAAWQTTQEETTSSISSSDASRVAAVKRKVRTQLNPTMVQAFKTEEGATDWSASILKELTTLGPKKSFAIEQIPWSRIPPGAEILFLQPELTTKKSSGEKKARLVVNGSQESMKEGENNYAPTSLSKSLQILFAIAAHEGRLIKGIDITAAFASESLTQDEEDIYVQYPPILEQHFGEVLDQQLEEQKVILEEETRTQESAQQFEVRNVKAAGGGKASRRREENSDDEDSPERKTQNARHRSKKWIERKAKKAKVHRVAVNGQAQQRRYGRLRKSLYGLRRAAKLFNRGLNKLLIEKDYEQCPVDKCIYRKISATGESILFNTHVDDFAVFPTGEAIFSELLDVLRSKYEITVTDRLEKHLGMYVNEYVNGAVGLSQPTHLQTLFTTCGFGDDHIGAEIPMPVDWSEADQDNSPKIDIESYRKLMGAVLFILKTRPDVSVAVSKQSGRTHKCTEKDSYGGPQTNGELLAQDATLGTCIPERLQQAAQHSVADVHLGRQLVPMLYELTWTEWVMREDGAIS